MIGFLVRGRVRVKIRIRVRVKIMIRVKVGVTFNVSVCHWSNCRRSNCRTFKQIIMYLESYFTHNSRYKLAYAYEVDLYPFNQNCRLKLLKGIHNGRKTFDMF